MALSIFMFILLFILLAVYRIEARVALEADLFKECSLKLYILLLFGVIRIPLRATVIKLEGKYCVLVRAFWLDIIIQSSDIKHFFSAPKVKKRVPRHPGFSNALKLNIIVRNVRSELEVGTGDAFSCAMVCEALMVAFSGLHAVLPFNIRVNVLPDFNNRKLRINLEGIVDLCLAEVTNEAVKLLLLSKGETNVSAASD